MLQENLLQQSLDAVAVVPGFVVGAIGLAMIGSFVRAAARPASADATISRPAVLPLRR